MKTRPKFRILALFAATFTSAFSAIQAASVISVNFGGDARGPDYEYTVSSTAGVVPAGSWNNYYVPGVINEVNNGLFYNLLNNSNAATNTYINYTNDLSEDNLSVWGLGQPVATISNDNSGLYNNFLNYFYHGAIYIGQLGEEFTEPGYKIIVYFADADAGWQNYTLLDGNNVSTTLYGRTNGAGVYANSPFGGFVQSTATTPETALSSNYVVFEGQTANNFRLTGFGEYVSPEGGGDYYTRPAIVGFQIVAVPEPGTVGLALFAAGASIVFLRRRQA